MPPSLTTQVQFKDSYDREKTDFLKLSSNFYTCHNMYDKFNKNFKIIMAYKKSNKIKNVATHGFSDRLWWPWAGWVFNV